MRVNPGAGEASFTVTDLPLEDFGNAVNSLAGGSSVPASLSLAVTWSGVQERLNIRNQTTGFAGEFVHNTATLQWSATEAGLSFVADPLDSDFAEVGHTRNGAFFP